MTLAPGESTDCAADEAYVITQADVDSGAVANTATGIGQVPNPEDPDNPDQIESPGDGVTVNPDQDPGDGAGDDGNDDDGSGDAGAGSGDDGADSGDGLPMLPVTGASGVALLLMLGLLLIASGVLIVRRARV